MTSVDVPVSIAIHTDTKDKLNGINSQTTNCNMETLRSKELPLKLGVNKWNTIIILDE